MLNNVGVKIRRRTGEQALTKEVLEYVAHVSLDVLEEELVITSLLPFLLQAYGNVAEELMPGFADMDGNFCRDLANAVRYLSRHL